MIKQEASHLKKSSITTMLRNMVLLSLLIHLASLAGEHEKFDAHVHGLSEMTIAIENNRLEIEMRSPAINLVGFEHRAATKENIAVVKQAESLLSQPQKIFSFTGGECKLIHQSLDLSSIKSTHHHTEKQHVKNHPQRINHSEVIANYHYHCRKISDLSAITVTIFDLFSGIQQMYVMWITQMQQNATMLSATNTVINLRVNHE